MVIISSFTLCLDLTVLAHIIYFATACTVITLLCARATESTSRSACGEDGTMVLLFHVLLFLSLYPILGHSCSKLFELRDRLETLTNGIERGEVYSAVVIGASCPCVADNFYEYLECRLTYSSSYTSGDHSQG